jgi:hypothetical protein
LWITADNKDKAELAARLKALDEELEKHGVYDVFPSFTAFALAAQHVQALATRRQVEAMRVNPNVGGYCFTQFQDAGMEFGAGVVDAFRRPKAVIETLAVVNAPLVLVTWCPRRNVTVGDTVAVKLWIVNEIGYEGEVTLEWALLDEDEDAVLKARSGAPIRPGINTLDPVELTLDVNPGHYMFEARLIYMGTLVRISRNAFGVFEPVSFDGCRTIHVVEPSDELATALDALGAPWTRWSADASSAEADASSALVLVPPRDKIGDYGPELLDALQAQAHAGAEVVFCELPKLDAQGAGADPDLTLGGRTFRVEWSYGLFLGGFHWARDDALFDGLPRGCLMNDFFRDIYPRASAFGLDVKPVAGTVMTFGTRLGADLVRLPHGSGTITLCHLRLLGNLARDAAAAVLVRNISRP